MSKVLRLFLTALVISLLVSCQSLKAQQDPKPADLLGFENPQSLILSPDGNDVLVRTKKADVENNTYTSTIRRLSTDSGTSQKLDLPKGAQSLEWSSDGQSFAYLAPSDMGRQVWIKKVGADSARQVTQKKGGVRSFSFSPNGNQIAFTSMKSRERSNKDTDKYKHSLEIDLEKFRAQNLFSSRLTPRTPPQSQLWIKDLKSSSSILVSDTLTIGGYKWSPTGNRLAFIAKPVSILKPGIPTLRIDILVYNVETNNLQLIEKGYQGQDVYENAISFSYPFWSPSGNRLGFVRLDRSKRWATTPDLGIYNFGTGKTRYILNGEDQELEAPDFHWIKPNFILVEFTDRARNGLFQISLNNGTISPLRVTDKHASRFSFSNSGKKTVWVEQSVGNPPEIYVGQPPYNSLKKISDLNPVENTWLPKAEYVEWSSEDGTIAQGWLIHPKNFNKEEPSPLLTLLHGGPGYDVNNKYQPYLQQWPYPVQIFAAKGYAVFLPNYRGTDSFGREYQKPDSRDKEPIHDVITGIEYLISKGLADRDKLGIMGHSHGVFVGPLVIDEKPIFKAASFAEGFGNLLSLYGQMHGWGNKEIHEYEMVNSTPYENPKRYLDLSPAFLENFTKTTPTMLEYGQESSAYQGLEIGKALWRQDTPHKFIIYPEGGHALQNPAVQVESMNRNIEWFQRWIPTDLPDAN